MYTFLAKITTSSFLAGGGDGQFKKDDISKNRSEFEDSSLWRLIKSLLFLFGVVAALIGLAKFVGKIGGGKIGEAAKTLIGTIAGCAFLFNPSWIFGIFEIAGNVMSAVLESFGGAAEAGDK